MLLQKMCNFTVDANYLCNISLFKPVTTEIIRLHALRTAGMKVVLKHINIVFFSQHKSVMLTLDALLFKK